MVLPEGKVDEAVLLHELLHIKYWGALQNSVWCICRALHWCNPLVRLTIDCAALDMESLCDQRVLERLEGKARRKQLEDGFLRGEGQKTASETVLLYPAVSYDQAAEASVKVRLEDGYRFDTDRGYRVQNLKEKDGGQIGLLILYLYTVPEGMEFVEKDRFDDMELTESYLPSGQLVCPVRVWREENRYVVEETGERAIYLSYDIPNGGAEYCERMVPELEAEKAVGKYGTMTVHRWSVYQVDNEEKAETSVWDWECGSGFCEIPKPDAAFSIIRWPWKVSYQCVDGWQDRENLQMVGLHVMPLTEEGEQPDFSELDAYLDISNLNASGSDNRGVSWNHCRVDETWNGEVTVEGVCETDTGLGHSADLEF